MIMVILTNVVLSILIVGYFMGLILHKNPKHIYCVINNENVSMAKFKTYKEALDFQQNKYYGYYKTCKIKDYYL